MNETGTLFEVVNVDDEQERFTLRPELEPTQSMIVSRRGVTTRPPEWLYRVVGQTQCIVTPPPNRLEFWNERPERFTIDFVGEYPPRTVTVRRVEN